MTTWDDLDLSPEHASLLERAAITPDVARGRVATVTEARRLPGGLSVFGDKIVPGLVFAWHSVGGDVVPQIRLDDTAPLHTANGHGPGSKYLFPPDTTPVLDLHGRTSHRLHGDAPVLLVEGTKQHLAAVSHLGDLDYPVLGMSGCYGWSSDGAPIPDLDRVDFRGREVVVVLDADLAHNRDVWEAATALRAELDLRGAETVRFTSIPDHGDRHRGLDDLLGRTLDPAAVLKRLVDRGEVKLPKAPPARRHGDGAAFFDQSSGKFLPDTFHRALVSAYPMALTVDGAIALYEGGVYRSGSEANRKAAFNRGVKELLGEDSSKHLAGEAEFYAAASLYGEGRFLPERVNRPVLNCPNGLLDLRDETVAAHSPEWLSTAQIAVEWNPEAECPTYERWLADVAGDQADDLEEVASTMLDPSRTPPKAALLFGPARSGKSTFLRLLERIVGEPNHTAVTLHQLADDRFAAANLYGKMLNSAADLSSAHVSDLTVFKMSTGEDRIHANRKYGAQFTFTNQALFVFCANDVPTVSENSAAYTERIRPFKFGASFAGAEDPSIEDAMSGELEGILVRLVRAWRRREARGGYRETDPEVAAEFRRGSDQVARWVGEECVIVARDTQGRATFDGQELPATHATVRTALYVRYREWAAGSGGSVMGRYTFYKRLTCINGVHEVRTAPSRTRGFNVVLAGGGGDGGGGGSPHEEGVAGDAGRNDPTLTERVAPSLARGSDERDEGKNFVFSRGGEEVARTAHTAMDLETAGSDVFAAGPGFVRLGGYRRAGGDTRITDDIREILHVAANETVVGHNLLGFDLIALAHHHGFDLERAVAEDRVVDTKILAALDDPPPAGWGSGHTRKHYSLDLVGKRVLREGKTDDPAGLARIHGGWGSIPVGDERFRDYLRGDVDLTGRLAGALPHGPYARREHRVAAIAARITLNGFRVDERLLRERLEAGRSKRERLLGELTDRYGLPRTKANGEFSDSPHRTKEGKAAIVAAFADLGITTLPKTVKGAPALGRDGIGGRLRERAVEKGRTAVVDLIDTVLELQGVRTVYQTVADNLVGDRVHPSIEMLQASGRWSTTEPGLTVMGKRDGRHVEREVFVPDPGEVVVCADLSQIDARAVAALSQDHAYMDLFEPGRDSHTEIARRVWGDPSRRQDAKAIGHGWNYGMGIRKLALTAGVSEQAAVEFDTAMREQFPRLVEWRDEVRARAASRELLDNGFGRPMRVEPSRAHTQAPALMGQGCARDLMMEGLLRLPRYVIPMLRAQVHDEIVLSVPAESVEEVERTVLDAFSFEWCPDGAARSIRVEAGLGKRGENWGHVYE